MESKKITLNLDKTLPYIAGNTYGERVFTEQVEKDFDGESPITIIFPKYIEGVAISFIQGFMAKMVERIGREKTIELLDIEAGTEFLTNKIKKDIYF